MFDKVLVLSPHRNDEVLGVGGTLQHCKEVHIHYFNDFHPTVPKRMYDGEAEKVKEYYKAKTTYSSFKEFNRLHLQPIANYISEIEGLINNILPDTIFIPAYSSNQDHRVVYEAAITATRSHDKNWFVPNVFIYEQTEYMSSDFVPNLFVPIDLGKKLEAFALYQSQQRGHRRPEYIVALAVLRGMEINTHYAEAFMVKRQTWKK